MSQHEKEGTFKKTYLREKQVPEKASPPEEKKMGDRKGNLRRSKAPQPSCHQGVLEKKNKEPGKESEGKTK